MDTQARALIEVALEPLNKKAEQTVIRLPQTPLSTPIGTPFPIEANDYAFSHDTTMWIDDDSDTSSIATIRDSVLDDDGADQLMLPPCPSPPLRATQMSSTGEYVLLRTAHALGEAEQLLLSQEHIDDIPSTLEALSQVVDTYTAWLSRCSDDNVTAWLETLTPKMSTPALPKMRVGGFELSEEETRFMLPRLVGFRLRRLRNLVTQLERVDDDNGSGDESQDLE